MAIAQEDLRQIGDYVKNNISDWIAEQGLGKPPVVYEIELRERMVRVEEELKHQRELMRQGFNQIDKRLDLMQADMDKRLELMRADMNKRFEQVDKRFESNPAPRGASVFGNDPRRPRPQAPHCSSL